MKKIGIALLVVVVVAALLLLGGYLYVRYMPERNLSKQAPDFSMTATRLAEEFETDPSAADKKFIDRVIEVTGVVADVSTDANNAVVFILRERENVTGVLCTVTEKSTQGADRYKIGDTIVLKGICTGMLFEVVLNRCMIID